MLVSSAQEQLTAPDIYQSALATIMAAMRPEEGAAVASLFRSKVDPHHQDLGLGEYFLEALDNAIAASAARPSSHLRKGG